MIKGSCAPFRATRPASARPSISHGRRVGCHRHRRHRGQGRGWDASGTGRPSARSHVVAWYPKRWLAPASYWYHISRVRQNQGPREASIGHFGEGEIDKMGCDRRDVPVRPTRPRRLSAARLAGVSGRRPCGAPSIDREHVSGETASHLILCFSPVECRGRRCGIGIRPDLRCRTVLSFVSRLRLRCVTGL